jgi:hypothetical protein
MPSSYIKEFYSLILLKSADWIPHSFLGTFIISYIMRISGNAIVTTALYNIFFYVFVFAASVLTFMCFKHTKILQSYRVGMFALMLVLTVIAIFKEQCLDYIWLLGGIYGIGVGLTATALNYLQQSLIKDQIKFSSYRTVLSGVVKTIFPILLGFLLGKSSFPSVSTFMLVCCLGIYILSFCLKPQIADNKNCKRLDLFGFIRKKNRSKLKNEINKLLFAEFLGGACGPINIVQTMLIIYLFHTDLNLGIIGSALMFGLIIFRFLFGRFGSQKYFRHIFVVSLGILAVGIFALINISEFNFLLYAFCFMFASSLVNLIYEPIMFTLFKSVKSYEKEFLIARELSLNAGRIMILILFTGLTVVENIQFALKWFLIGLIFIYFIQTLIAYNINKTLKVEK